jgi:hypothetical protein
LRQAFGGCASHPSADIFDSFFFLINMQISHFKKIARDSLLAFLAVGATASHAQVAHLELTIGSHYSPDQHYDVTYTPENSEYFDAWVLSKTPSGEATYLYFSLGTPGFRSDPPWLNLAFSTANLSQPIAAGTYTDAKRASFASTGHAGFDISFNHSGNNAVWGSFTVEKATFSSDGKIQELSCSFEAFGSCCYGGDYVNKYTGTFIYSAVPEPGSQLLLALGIAGLFASRTLRVKPTALTSAHCQSEACPPFVDIPT